MNNYDFSHHEVNFLTVDNNVYVFMSLGENFKKLRETVLQICFNFSQCGFFLFSTSS